MTKDRVMSAPYLVIIRAIYVYEVFYMFLQLNAFQSQGVGNHRNGGKSHRCGGNYRTEEKAKKWIKHTGGNGDTRGVVCKGPE